jgi:hypothetical protein
MAFDLTAPGAALSVECHISRSLINRRLSGEELADDLQSDLESHLKVCTACQKFVDEKRLELADRIKSRTSAAAAVANEAPEAALNLPSEKLGKLYGNPKTPAGHRARTIVFSTMLAAVLFGMSAVAKDPGSLFGPKASAKAAAEEPKEEKKDDAAPVTEEAPPEVKPTEDAAGAEEPAEEKPAEPVEDAFGTDSQADDSLADEKPKPAEPKKEEAKPAPPQDDGLMVAEDGAVKQKAAPKPKPRPAPRAPARPRAAAKAPVKPAPKAAPKPAPKAAPQGFTVYDENGNKIK